MEENNIPTNLDRIYASTLNLIKPCEESKTVEEDENANLKIEQFNKMVNECLDKWSSEGLVIEFVNKVRDFLDKLGKRLEYSAKFKLKYEKIQLFKITAYQLRFFLEACHRKYQQSKLDPGTAIGSLSAQSIGEFRFL